MEPSCRKSEFYPLRLLPEKKKLQTAHGKAEPFFFRHAAVIMGGTTPTHPTCEAVSSGVKKIKFLLGP